MDIKDRAQFKKKRTINTSKHLTLFLGPIYQTAKNAAADQHYSVAPK